MSVPEFYAADMSDAVFTMSLTENPYYPLNNLHSNVPSIFWRSSANTNGQSLIIDLGTAKDIDFVGLGYHNWTSIYMQISVQYDLNDNPSFPNPVSLIPATNPFTTFPIVLPFSLVTRRYFRIYFTDTYGNTPACGLLYFGKRMTMLTNYNMDAELGNRQFATTSKESLSGMLRTSRQVAGRERQEFTFTLIDDATVTAWQTFMDAIQGRLNPFFFKDGYDNLDIWHSEDDYIPAKGMRANVNQLSRIKMCRQVTGSILEYFQAWLMIDLGNYLKIDTVNHLKIS